MFVPVIPRYPAFVSNLFHQNEMFFCLITITRQGIRI